MPAENKLIPTRTTVTTTATTIRIFVEYFPDDYFDLSFFVVLVDQVRDGIVFIGGDLGYSYVNITDLFEINDDGDLIVNSIYPGRYAINDDGDLIYTTV